MGGDGGVAQRGAAKEGKGGHGAGQGSRVATTGAVERASGWAERALDGRKADCSREQAAWPASSSVPRVCEQRRGRNGWSGLECWVKKMKN